MEAVQGFHGECCTGCESAESRPAVQTEKTSPHQAWAFPREKKFTHLNLTLHCHGDDTCSLNNLHKTTTTCSASKYLSQTWHLWATMSGPEKNSPPHREGINPLTPRQDMHYPGCEAGELHHLTVWPLHRWFSTKLCKNLSSAVHLGLVLAHYTLRPLDGLPLPAPVKRNHWADALVSHHLAGYVHPSHGLHFVKVSQVLKVWVQVAHQRLRKYQAGCIGGEEGSVTGVCGHEKVVLQITSFSKSFHHTWLVQKEWGSLSIMLPPGLSTCIKIRPSVMSRIE